MTFFRAVALLWSAAVASSAAVKRPHILLILADDLGWNDLPWHGSDQISAPTLSRLATEGVILEGLYVEPICSPTRASLLSGRHIAHTGIFQPFKPDKFNALNQSCNLPTDVHCMLLPQALKQLDYHTHMVGKWHLGYWNWLQTPRARGFDSFYGYLNGEGDYFTHTREYWSNGTRHFGYDFWDGVHSSAEANNTYSTDLFTERATQLIEEHNASEPFFLYLAWQAMHVPLQAPAECTAQYEHTIADLDRRTVAGMVSCMDTGVATILRALAANENMLEDTTIVFLSDNGGAVTLGDLNRNDPADVYRSNYASNMPLRGQKTTYFEGGVRSAAFVSGAGVHGSGSKSSAMIHVTDLYPSLLAHAARGIGDSPDPAAAAHLHDIMSRQPAFTLGDGIEQWSTIVQAPDRPEADPRNETLHVVHRDDEHGPAVLRVADWKLFANNSGRDTSWDGQNAAWFWTFGQSFSNKQLSIYCPVPKQGGNLTNPVPPSAGDPGHCDPGSAPCLFNIASDPCEQINLASARPDLVQSMLKRLEEYRKGANRDQSKGGSLPDRCLPDAMNNTWSPCFGSPPQMSQIMR